MHLVWILSLLNYTLAAVLGIDFGAEYTKSALVAPQVPFEILLTPEAKRKDASGLVFRVKNNEIERFYGSSGLPYTSRFAPSSLYYLKGLLGQTPDSPALAEYNAIHPGIELLKNKRNGISAVVNGTAYPVEQLVAMNFKEIKSRAQQELKSKLGSNYVSDTAISVPGHFSMAQRRAITDAASLADLRVISLVNDGTAVGLNYASTRQFTPEKQYIVVYDMGSESTSSTLLSIQDVNGTTTIAVEGYDSVPMGGKTLTKKVRDILITEFQTKSGFKGELEPRTLNRLWREAERAKAVLSANTEVSVFIESLYKEFDLTMKISRKQLEQASQDFIDEITTPLALSLITFDGQEVEPSQLEAVILAGGGTRVPIVQDEIREYAGPILSKNVNADESAVLGTTLRGVGISGIFRSRPITVIDKSYHSYSLTDGNDVYPLFERGSVLDSSKSFNFPAQDTTLSLMEDNKKIASWTLPMLKEGLKSLETESRVCNSDPEINVRFALTNSEIVELQQVTVRCKTIPVDGDELDVKTVSSNLNAKRTDVGVAPLTSPQREELSYGIRQLDKQDADRLRKHTLHNNLESLLYKIRELEPEEPRANEILEIIEDEQTIVKLNQLYKEAEALYYKYKPIDETEQFTLDLQAAFDAAGIVADASNEKAVHKVLAETPIDQLAQVSLQEKVSDLHDEFNDKVRRTLKERAFEAEAVESSFETTASEPVSSSSSSSTAETSVDGGKEDL